MFLIHWHTCTSRVNPNLGGLSTCTYKRQYNSPVEGGNHWTEIILKNSIFGHHITGLKKPICWKVLGIKEYWGGICISLLIYTTESCTFSVDSRITQLEYLETGGSMVKRSAYTKSDLKKSWKYALPKPAWCLGCFDPPSLLSLLPSKVGLLS